PTKDDLYRAILEMKIAESERGLRIDARVEAKSDEEFLLYIARSIMQRMEADDTFLRLLIRSALDGHDLAGEFRRVRGEKVYAFVEDRLRRRARRPRPPSRQRARAGPPRCGRPLESAVCGRSRAGREDLLRDDLQFDDGKARLPGSRPEPDQSRRDRPCPRQDLPGWDRTRGGGLVTFVLPKVPRAAASLLGLCAAIALPGVADGGAASAPHPSGRLDLRLHRAAGGALAPALSASGGASSTALDPT